MLHPYKYIFKIELNCDFFKTRKGKKKYKITLK